MRLVVVLGGCKQVPPAQNAGGVRIRLKKAPAPEDNGPSGQTSFLERWQSNQTAANRATRLTFFSPRCRAERGQADNWKKEPLPRVPPKNKAAAQRPATVARRVAASVASGETVTAAARAAGVCRQTASGIVNSPLGQLLITTLVEAEAVQIRRIFTASLHAIEDALEAERFIAVRGDEEEGDPDLLLPAGPDHYARLTAVKCLTSLLTAGRQAMKPPDPPRRTITMEELTALLQAHDPKALQ